MSSNNKKKLSIGELPGKLWRNSTQGKLLKGAITNKYTMRARDSLLSKLPEDKEHLKRFAQYLTGGVEGNVVTDLPKTVRQDVKASHLRGDYPEREATILAPDYEKKVNAAKKSGNEELWNALVHGNAGEIKNPNYNPNSNLLSTYSTRSLYNIDGKLEGGTMRTAGSIGHAQFKQNKDGSHTLTDKYDVDPPESFDTPDLKNPYIPFISKRHPDLREGGWAAARAYDVSRFLGINKDFNYKVNFPAENKKSLQIPKNKND